ncbi:hypothetical protein [Roseateles albus]|uniref:KfrA N-terminal DNA-binding domain-containing protein n=1 Tax=Roseateles albus TaxID=2987525 RepID=A0ABT5KI63_9BURK|nr:hypothetical protein [Roseateles albus]MDC8773634.1 hypothetical protein [Roseateles albus]
MEQPTTPIQALQAWLAAQTPGAALAGVPVGSLLTHFLQAQAQGLPSAGHELRVLQVLVDHWLKRMHADIESFPPGAVAVLSEQKKQLLNMHKALSELQSCLQVLHLSRAKSIKPAASAALSAASAGPAPRASERPKSWQSSPLKKRDKERDKASAQVA